jgi:hypothetical protein
MRRAPRRVAASRFPIAIIEWSRVANAAVRIAATHSSTAIYRAGAIDQEPCCETTADQCHRAAWSIGFRVESTILM